MQPLPTVSQIVVQGPVLVRDLIFAVPEALIGWDMSCRTQVPRFDFQLEQNIL